HRQDLPDHDARAFVSRLAVANGGISYNEPSELNSLAFSVRFHSVPFNHPPNPLGLQAATRNQSRKMLNCATRHDRTNMRTYKPWKNPRFAYHDLCHAVDPPLRRVPKFKVQGFGRRPHSPADALTHSPSASASH